MCHNLGRISEPGWGMRIMELSALQVVVAVIGIFVAVIGICFSGIVSFIVARWYGDMAAVRATRKYHEEDARKARAATLLSLRNEVSRIQKAAEHNSQLNPAHSPHDIARIPTAAFETAFVSGRPGLDVSPDLLDASTEYLTCADSINSLIDAYLSALGGESSQMVDVRNEAVRKIAKACGDTLPNILGRLSTCLQRELDEADG